MAERFWNDLVYAARTLAHDRGATAVAVLSIAVAIGPNAALFSILDRVFLPGGLARAPETVFGVRMRSATGFEQLSYGEYRDLKEQNRVFSRIVAGYRTNGMAVMEDARELIATSLVSSDYFAVLRVEAQAGRLFEAQDDRRTDIVPVVVSDDFWRRRLGARQDVIGQSILFDERTVAIIGVVEPGFRGLHVFVPTDMWAPLDGWLAVDPATRRLLGARDARALEVIGLLRDGVTKRQVQDDLDEIAARFVQEYPDVTGGRSFVTWAARDDDRRRRVGVTAVALGLAGLLLLVACTNVATMLLARAESRRRDSAVRLALGASRWQLFRLHIAEALLLSMSASALGLLLAHWLLRLSPALKPVTPLPIVFTFDVNLAVVVYTSLLAIATTAICALAPLWHSRTRDLVGALRSDSDGHVRGRRFARSRFAALLAAQIGITQVLLCGAALLLRSYQNILGVRLGFDPDKRVLMVTVAPHAQDQPPIRYAELAERLAALPGVRTTSFIDNAPLSGFGYRVLRIRPDNQADDPAVRVSTSTVGLGYFTLVGTRVLHGRAFERGDVEHGRALIVNEHLVRRVFPSLAQPSDAIGRWLRTDSRTLEIVGIVENGKYGGLRELPQPHAYQLAPTSWQSGMTLLVETTGGPEPLASPVRETLRAAEPNLWIIGVTTLREHARLARVLDEFGALITGTLGGLSLALAAVGLYGLTAFWVRRRMRECGIRMALGATPRQVIALMQVQAVRPVLAGLILGVAGGVLLGHLLSSVLFGVRPYDALALISGVLFTSLVTFSATRIPARRCTRDALGSLLKEE